MKKLFILLAVSLLFFSACAQKEVIQDVSTVPAITQEQIVEGLNTFAFDFYNSITKQALENTFYSPLSISSALAMTYAGAEGETAKQMQQTLHYGPQDVSFHSQFANLIESLRVSEKSDFEMTIANAVWVQNNYKLQKNYLQIVKGKYLSEAREIDFISQPDASRETINEWVSDKTANRIHNLIPPNAINAMTRMILTNAVYFNAEWSHKFNPKMTRKESFYCMNGEIIETDMMYQRHYYQYSQTSDYQMLELTYKGYEYSMLIILPKNPGGLSKLNKRISCKDIAKHDNSKQQEDILVYLPKFRLETAYELNAYLMEMGMTDAFSQQADFSGMTGNKDLMISSIFHKAFIEVDEEKTEAAAATAVVMKLTAMAPSPVAPIEFRADHPFMFIIRNQKEKAILFMGQLTTPKAL